MFKQIMKYTGRVFAAIGFLVVLAVAGGVWLAMHKASAPPKIPEKIILVVNFNTDLVEEAEDMPISLRSFVDTMTQDREVSVHDVVGALERGSKDAHVLGVIGLFGKNLPHMAHGQEIRAALQKFREAGKFSYAFSPSFGDFGPSNSAYYLASAFEKIWVQPVGTVGLSGLQIEQPFARAALEKAGVKAHFVQREEYKTAFEFLSEDKMPAPAREMMQSMLDDMNEQLASGIAASRSLPIERVKELMAGGPYTAQEALDKKLIDQIGYSDEIDKIMNDTYGKKAMMRPEEYVDLPLDMKKNPMPKETVAFIVAHGEIADRAEHYSPLSGGETMDAREVAEALRDAAEDKEVKLIIVRVDSPGGSPSASETIRRALVKAQDKGKKVIISMGAMAGSGGYWIAMNGDRIFADPATLTGSIGVLGGKFILAGLYEKLGINWDVLQTGGNMGMWSMLHDYTPAEQARMDALIDDTYNTFRENVSKARKIPMDKMPAVSKGRVFTGAQAVKNGLVDELGGLSAAIAYAKTSMGLQPTDLIMLKQFPPAETPAEKLEQMLRQYFEPKVSMPNLGVAMNQLHEWLASIAAQPVARMPYIGLN